MRTSALVLLTFTALAGPAFAQSGAAPTPDQSQAAPATPTAPQAPLNPQAQQGAMMCGMMKPGQQTQGQPSGGYSCCGGMMGGQPQRQGAMPMMDHSQMAQMHQGQGPAMGFGSAAQDAGGHSGISGMSTAQPTDTPATKALRDANARMHRDMDIRYTNDVDVDFARSMIPHHQGAIDMARAGLKGADNAESKRLAEKTIRENEKAMAELKEWVSKHAKKEGNQ